MGKRHKKHHRDNTRDENDDTQSEKPLGLKLVLKVGTPLTPSDVATDSRSETFDSDTGMSEKKFKVSKRHLPNDKAENEEKKRKLDNDDSDDGDEDEDDDDQIQMPVYEVAESEDDVRVRNLRDKRNADDDKSALHFCLDYLHRILQRKDGNGFFAFPVTDNIAPGYSSIISYPMDFSTMRAKIDAGEYRTVAAYRYDYQRMMENCIQYNHPETVYHREAKRLLSVGLKHMSREQLLLMKRNLPAAASLTMEEIGMDDDAPENPGNTSITEFKSKSSKDRSSQRKQSLGRFEAIPDNMTPDEILRQAQSAAAGAADRLALRSPDSKFGFLRRREDGSTTLNILNPDNSGMVSDKERVVCLGELIGKLNSGTGTLIGLKEDRRNKINPINYLSYGAFGSYGPIYDSTASNLNKEDSDLLLATYGDEIGLQYAKSLQHFVADAGQYSVQMVDNLLDILTNGEHSKTSAVLTEKEQQRIQQEQEEAKKRLEMESNRHATESHQEMNSFEAENQRRLDNLSSMLAELHRLQNARLSSQLPDHLSGVKKPSDEETELASKISNELAQMVKQVEPSDVVSVQTLRNALGVTSQPVVDVTTTEHKQTELDEDLNEFFGVEAQA